MDHNSNNVDYNVDRNIISLLKRDFRTSKNLTPQEHLYDFVKWRLENKFVLETVEWLQSIIGQKGLSLDAAIRLLNRFSDLPLETQKKTILNLLGNNRFIDVRTSFQLSKEGKLELNTYDTYLFLKITPKACDNPNPDSSCYG